MAKESGWELLSGVLKDQELEQQLETCQTKSEIAEVATQHGYDFTEEELSEFLSVFHDRWHSDYREVIVALGHERIDKVHKLLMKP